MQPASKSTQRVIYLRGLTCAVCARKIEEAAAKIDGVKSASVDLVTQRLMVETHAGQDEPRIMREAGNVAREIEPDIQLSYSRNQQPSAPRFRKGVFYASLSLGTALFAAALFLGEGSILPLVLYICSYLMIGGKVVLRALKNLAKGRLFDENFLMSLATVSAFIIGEYPEGVAVMLFYQIGELLQEAAVGRSRRSIAKLMDIRPDYANLQTADGLRRVSPEEVCVGDIIAVRPGEKIPLDGVVKSGVSSIDTSALTGESMPLDAEAGTIVQAGCVNLNGLLTIVVTKPFGESTVSKILDLVQNSRKAPSEAFITRFSRRYTPAVVLAAAVLAFIPPLFIKGATLSDWVNRALVFLVVSCPCALVVSIPLGFFGGIGGASRNGILMKGGGALEALSRVETAVFDKTGTLTQGVFRLSRIVSDDPDTLLYYAAHAERGSAHPIAVSVQNAFSGSIDESLISGVREEAGFGVSAVVNGKKVLAGNARLMRRENIAFDEANEPGAVVYVAIDGRFAGYLAIADTLRQSSARTIAALKKLGVKKTVMLTGDSKDAGEAAAAELGIDEVHTGLLPHQKVEELERLSKNKKGTLMFVGDGINDAPVLARADVGVAMGGAGSDAAIEAADVVLMTDEPDKLLTAVSISRKTRRIVTQNIVFSLCVKGALLLLGAFGAATMWEAVFGDVGVALIAILNASRAMRIAG